MSFIFFADLLES